MPVVPPGRTWDADLVTVIDAWANLPEANRAGILAMVKATKPG